MKIAVFGASVSHQTVHHQTGDVTGYCEVIRREHLNELGASELIQITYPGNRFSDGGLIRVDDVTAAQPDICIIEPLIEDISRGVETTRDEAEYVYRKILLSGARPVALFLPEPPKRLHPKLVNGYDLHRSICDSLSIPIIEIDISETTDLDSKFRSVHTLLPGARLYAQVIVAALKDLPHRTSHVSDTQARTQVLSKPYSGGPIYRRNELILESEAACKVRLIQKQSIGPHSPLLDVTKIGPSATEKEVVSVWDPYCHFPRDSFVTIFNGSVEEGRTVISFSCSASAPAHKSAPHQLTAWPSAVAKELRPLGPWYLVTDGPARFI